MSEMIVIRASSLSSYPDCARRTAANSFPQAIENAGYTLRQTTSNVGASIGTATHEGVAYSLYYKQKEGVLGNDKDAHDTAIAKLEESFKEDHIFDIATKNKDEAIYQTKSLLNSLRTNVLHNIKPTLIEKRLEAKIGNIILSGQVDSAEYDGINDWKTGRVKRFHINQIGAYGLLARSHGRGANRGTEYFAQRVRSDKEQPPPIRTEYDMVVAENSALGVLKKIGNDLNDFLETGNRFAFIANPSSMLCSDKYCKAWGTDFCREHKKD